tara:strand:- start:1396 stop:2049 length:654 start_codon:yes stop_codon:yes gene_type:complete
MNKKITAVIPVRKGSVRVKNKNIRDFGGTSLLELKIDLLKTVVGLDKIVVNSDSEEMLCIARGKGVDTFLRDEHFASSTINNSEYFEHIAQVTQSDHIMYAPVTCPFVSKNTFEKCIKSYQELEDHDSLMTVFDVKHHMWLAGEPMNYDPKNSPNSQDLPDILGVHYGVSIISRKACIENRNVVGENPFFVKLNGVESVDIDTELEFKFAEFIYSNL